MPRPRATLALLLGLLSGCATTTNGSRSETDAPLRPADEARELAELHARWRVPEITTRRFTHRELWGVLGPLADRAPSLAREEVGRSVEGRPIYALRHGSGPVTVLLWSQMHGDESTATMALLDLFHLLAAAPDDPRVQRLAERLTLVAIPMLNPDGAERFQRRNAYGIDVNRDARALATPEARALKAVHTRYRPDFGFNLHDQSVRTRVGTSERLAAIALLAPPFDATRGEDAVRRRAKRVAAVVRHAVEPLVPGHVARYDDTFNPRAFGDLVQSWGTSTVLIESGGWRDDPEKQYLRRVNFVALLAALDAIATGAYAAVDPAAYESLPYNGERVSDLLIRGGTLVLPGRAPVRADLTVNFDDPLRRVHGRITDIGDLAEAVARDTLDLSGRFLHPAPAALRAPGPLLAPGAPAAFTVRRTADADSEVLEEIGKR